MEKIIDGITYVLREPNTMSGVLCKQCAGNRPTGLCFSLGPECTFVEHEAKVWIVKEKSDESQAS